MKPWLLLLFLSLSSNLFAQENKFNEEIFKNELLNSVWSNDGDSSNTIIILKIKKKTLELIYLDYAEALLSFNWQYSASFKDNLVFFTLKNTKGRAKNSFMYGYIRKDGALILNFTKEEIKNENVNSNNNSDTFILFKYKE